MNLLPSYGKFRLGRHTEDFARNLLPLNGYLSRRALLYHVRSGIRKEKHPLHKELTRYCKAYLARARAGLYIRKGE